jgi:hypothetical protein
MELGLRDQVVTKQNFGYTLSLETNGGFEVRIENEFSLRTPTDSFDFSPEPSNAESKPLKALVEQVITSSAAEESGRLMLAFGNGTSLRVAPSEAYEAWTVTGPGGMRVVCMPDGELVVWKAENT